VEALQDVELTGTNRPCGLTANLKPIQVGLRGDDGYRDRRRAVARIEDCQSVDCLLLELLLVDPYLFS
jgi:hypothetical protein